VKSSHAGEEDKMGKDNTQALPGPAGHPIAYRRSEGTGPAIVWLGGFRSDMTGTKAEALHVWAEGAGRAFVRFDYGGHGQSGAAFEACTISTWLEDTLFVIDKLTQGPVVLVGSSMGGWLALLAAKARAGRVRSLVLIAPAPDFTESVWGELTFAERRAVADQGKHMRPSAYGGGPDVFTRALFEDGRKHLLLPDAIPFEGPVRIMHGQKDDAVHWRLSLLLAERLTTEDLVLSLIKDGEHRLSRPADLNLLIDMVDEVA
jgi:pimeloyl-ACP methyl ester carboxylesterase